MRMSPSWSVRWKKTTGRFLLCILTGAAGIVLPAPGHFDALAYEVRPVLRADGSALFELHFFDKGEAYQQYENDLIPGYSPWQLSANQKQAITQAAELWAEVIGSGSKSNTPVPIVVGTYLEYNADAGSQPNPGWQSVLNTGMQDALIYGKTPNEPALIRVGPLDLAIPDHLSPIPVTAEQPDLISVLYHEIGHGLGVYSMAAYDDYGRISTWDAHLRNDQGVWLKPGMDVVKKGDEDEDIDPNNVFIVGEEINSGVRFHGKHVAEVMGNDDGLLIEGFEGYMPDLSHIELERSSMSHQWYRNYTTFMEAELAALQDIGYSIDRKNFFGYSVYGDGLTLTSTHGYFARNANGTAWIKGQANTATLGVGLHIYGKRNDVTQAADLLAGGVAGTGIRVDGSNNTLRIGSGVLVAADGLWGTGLLVAYGKQQRVINQGTIQALGQDGVAARFDFGSNAIGNEAEYRGSWIWTNYDGNKPISGSGNKDENGFELNLDGELVSAFDVSGTLAGKAASIYISENAWVRQINVLTGANITGSILSKWNPNDKRIQYSGNRQDLHTQLTFGLASQADGSAGTQADPHFDMTLYGSIIGGSSIDMQLKSGHLAVTGTMEVFSLNNNGHLTLMGMDDSGQAARVGTFVNSAQATLETGFMANGQVAGISATSAEIDGKWLLRPMRDFYPTGAAITPESPVGVTEGAPIGNFHTIDLVTDLSPTLNFALSSNAESAAHSLDLNTVGTAQIHVSRAADAYSRYATTQAAASVGDILDDVANEARGDMQKMLEAMDWSDRDGRVIGSALEQLGPQAYDASARAALAQQGEFNVLLMRRMLTGMHPVTSVGTDACDDASDWQVWATPYGSNARQHNHGDVSGWKSTGVGLLAGMDRHLDDGLALGVHMGLVSRRTTVTGVHDALAKTQSALVGIHGLMAPQDWSGFYLTAQARLGLEDDEMRRTVSFNGYVRQNESHWTGLTGSVLLGAGKDWEVSFDDGLLNIGPVGWLEYAFWRRPDASEDGGQSSRLQIESKTYGSLQLALGAHTGWSTTLESGYGLGLDMLAAWRHELLDATLHTEASFRDYDQRGFRSSTELIGRNAMLLQGSLRLNRSDRFTAQLDVGGEFLRTSSASANIALSFGWKF